MGLSCTVGGVEHKYVLSGSQIVAEYYGTTTNIYLYDDSGAPIGLATRQSSDADGVYQYYYFEKNLQGDILGIYTASGQKVVWYMYDAYGNITTAIASGYGTLRDSNPFRYRGYYYDTETGFYYLNSRYYDPVTGRFISMDDVSVVTASPTALTDKNLFSYCDNNPVMRVDNGGEYWEVALPFLPFIDGPLPFADVIAVGLTLLTVAATGSARWEISLPKWKAKDVAKEDEKTIYVDPKGGQTYYHVTSRVNADAIKATGMMGSPAEAGYIFAWKVKPSVRAIRMSGAHYSNRGVIISFKTNAPFEKDHGIEDPCSNLYFPVSTVFPLPIRV